MPETMNDQADTQQPSGNPGSPGPEVNGQALPLDAAPAVFAGVDRKREITNVIIVGQGEIVPVVVAVKAPEIPVPAVSGTSGEAAVPSAVPPPETPTAEAQVPENGAGDAAVPGLPVDIGIQVKTPGVHIVALPNECRLPNFTLGKSVPCEWTIPEGVHFKFDEVKWGDVKVERRDDVLRFTPSKDGEVELSLVYNDTKTVTFRMTVNPDPWSLWTIKPMGEESIVFDSDSQRLAVGHQNKIGESHPGLKIVGACRRGRSHEMAGTFRDDDMGVWSDEARGNYVFLVADGAGSCKYSREGARQAIDFIKAKLEDNKAKLEEAWTASQDGLKPDCRVGMLLAFLASKARDHLISLAGVLDAAGKDCKVKDLSCTLLLAALKLDAGGGARLVTFNIGDGAIACRFGGERFELMCRPDSGEFGGGTRFLVTPEVWKKIFYPRKDIPWAWNAFCESRVFCRAFTPEEARQLQIFLMSDGVSDPWFESDAGLEDAGKWSVFASDVLLGRGENQAGLDLVDEPAANAAKLLDWLYFRIAGNHDDRTLIMAYTTADAETKGEANV